MTVAKRLGLANAPIQRSVRTRLTLATVRVALSTDNRAKHEALAEGVKTREVFLSPVLLSPQF
jgi:hypothetical protein